MLHASVLELSLTRSIAKNPQSFGGFRKIGPAEVKAIRKLVFQRKLAGVACAPPRSGAKGWQVDLAPPIEMLAPQSTSLLF